MPQSTNLPLVSTAWITACNAVLAMLGSALLFGDCWTAAYAQAPPTAVAVPAPRPNPGAFKTGPTYIWVEGEDAARQTFTPTKGRWSIRAGDGHSGGAYVAASASGSPTGAHTATWEFKVEVAGEYEVWARIGWRHWNDHEWRIDRGPWTVSTAVGGNYESLRLPIEGGVAEASWITYGKVKLDAGDHALSIRLAMPKGKRNAQQFFDCFCLSRVPFVPMGRFRPDEKAPANPVPGGVATQSWWPFRPAYRLEEKPVLDFAFLNDPVGAHGFVAVKDGDLAFDDGTPVRFWGTNASYWGGQMIYMEKLDAERFAAHLAHLGVNCLRIHVLHTANSLMDTSYNDTQHLDPLKLDRLDWLLYALAQRGIYVNIDLMYHRTFLEGDQIDAELIRPAAAGKGDPKYNVSWACGAAAFWHPRALDLNLALYRQFLTRVNPYTKKALVESPQMAMVTVHNEQSIFWGTTNMRKGRTAEILDEIFTAWLKRKYGSQDALAKAWQIEGRPSPIATDESIDAGLVKVGQIVMTANGANDHRVEDQKRFLYDMETGFYQKWIDQMRSWGVKCPIITSNWNGAGNTTRLVLQASTLGGVVDRHNYFTRPESMLTAIGKGTPMVAFEQQGGRAFSISEWNHGTDGIYGAETVPLMATVAAIQGWDALYHFSASSPTWQMTLGGLNTVPQHAVLYPFASMIWRRGDVRTGPLVFERRRDPEHQFGDAKEARVMSTDPAATSGEKAASLPVPAEIIALGRIENVYVDKRTPDLFREDLLKSNWDRQGQVITSAAGDVLWCYGQGWVKLDTARTQGGFGAIAGRRIACKDVTIESPNTHATILVSSLDGKPLGNSDRLVVGVVGRSAPNAIAPDIGPRGAVTPPCLMEPVAGTVAVRTGLSRVMAVSPTGYKIVDVAAKAADGKLTFNLIDKPQVVYYVIQ